MLDPINRAGDTVRVAVCKDGVVTTAPGFKDAYKLFCETGWNAMPFDPEYGGQGLPALVTMAVHEMWKSANMAFGLCPMLTSGAIEAIAHHASDELKQKYLPKMVEGKWTGTMNLTEPQAGSDLAAIRTKADAGRRRHLPRQRHQDLHHLGRARLRREHRPPGAGPPAGCAAGREGHFAVRRAEVPGQ